MSNKNKLRKHKQKECINDYMTKKEREKQIGTFEEEGKKGIEIKIGYNSG